MWSLTVLWRELCFVGICAYLKQLVVCSGLDFMLLIQLGHSTLRYALPPLESFGKEQSNV